MNWKQMELGSSLDTAPDQPNDNDFPAFAPLVSDAFEHFKNLPPRTSIASGTTLLLQGEPCESVYLILGGLVKLVHTNAEGNDATLGLRASGWCSGATFALMETHSIYSVITLTACEVIRVPAEEFSCLLMKNSKLMRHFTATVCNELISQSAAQAEVMISSAQKRLATFMRERALDGPKCKVLDTLPYLRQAELAKLLSISPEHLSRLLHKSSPRAGAERRLA